MSTTTIGVQVMIHSCNGCDTGMMPDIISDYFRTGPLTPAPMTLGSSSLPIVSKVPIAQLMRNTMNTVNDARSQNGVVTSFF